MLSNNGEATILSKEVEKNQTIVIGVAEIITEKKI